MFDNFIQNLSAFSSLGPFYQVLCIAMLVSFLATSALSVYHKKISYLLYAFIACAFALFTGGWLSLLLLVVIPVGLAINMRKRSAHAKTSSNDHVTASSVGKSDNRLNTGHAA